MIYKIFALIVPLAVSSLIKNPCFVNFNSPQAISSKLTIKPISLDSSFSSIPTGTDYFDCDTYGPFPLSSVTNDTEMTFTYQLYSISSQSIIERIRLLDSSNIVAHASSKPSKSYICGTRNTVTFTVPLRDYLTNNGLTLKFDVLRASDRYILKSYSVTFYPPSNSTVSWVYLKQNVYTSKSLGFYAENNAMQELIEKLDFTHFGDYLDVDYYYRLDLSKNTISYPNNCAFRFTNAYLAFNDKDRLFPYYPHQVSGDINIPLKMVKVGNTIVLQFKNNFYINKRTLQISNSYRTGFVLTKDFYLPINGKSKFNGKQLYFVLEGIGLDNISTTIPLKYDVSKSLVGVCKDGDYCVIGGRRQ